MIVEGDNLTYLPNIESESIDLIYIDPPFNTGRTQEIHGREYKDKFDSLVAFLKPRIEQAHRILKPFGSFFLHLDYREVHYCKVMMDEIFGRDCFQNEIIWAYDYGGRSKSRWPAKHDNILWYTKHPTKYTFNLEECDRIEYMAPKLVGEEKAARGKTPTDVWWHTIVHTTGAERLDYPTQKPLGILERIIKVHSNPQDLILDFFAGTGTAGEAAAKHKRSFICIDSNPQAVEIMKRRLEKYA
jgi:site-specific DNA-methyltransferase (adenine-specific)